MFNRSIDSGSRTRSPTPRLRRLVTAAVLVALAACAGDSPPKQPPNIIFIFTDDQEDLLDNMALLRQHLTDQGVSFSRFFISDPLCCPSRASVLTGQYAHNHGVLSNRLPLGGFEKFRDLGHESSTIATWLQRGGYRTALIGKYLNRYPGDTAGSDPSYVPPGWDHFVAYFAPNRTSGNYYNYFINENHDVRFFGNLPDDYITDSISRKVLAFLDATEEQDARPFFLHVTPNAPHRPPRAAPRHAGVFSTLQAPRRGAFNEADMSDKPLWYRNLPLISAQALRNMDRLHGQRQETLLAVDEMVGEMVQRLEALGELDNTFIFFASDNGFILGQHRFTNGKDAPYEESIRVPLVVRGPGVPAGRVIPHLSVNIDLPATFAELGGVSIPPSVDGRSLVPLLDGSPPPESDWRADLLIEHWPASPGGLPAYAGLRTREHTYVEYDTGEIELYDLRSDPGQEQSLHDSADPVLLERLADRLAELRLCRGEGCR